MKKIKNKDESNTLILHFIWMSFAITIIYLAVSFSTGAWYITWIIFLIGSFIQQAIKTFMMIDSDKE